MGALDTSSAQARLLEVVFVDWISTKEHRSFNESLLSALSVRGSLLVTFAEVMRMRGQHNLVLPGQGGRLARAWKVGSICWAVRKRPILLLSYDPVLFPLLQLFCRRLYVYEHNTTPEGAMYRKHAVWQRLFFRRVIRFAQFPAQHETLKRIGQCSHLLGSPLPPKEDVARPNPVLYVAPSDRIEPDVLVRLGPLIGRSEIVVRKFRFSADDLEFMAPRINVTPVSYIDTDHYLPLTKAFAIAISSRVRGSGWFNEGIRYGIPLIIIERGAQEIFEKTFPGYPYVAPDRVGSPSDLEVELQKVSEFDRGGYIVEHNARLKRVFEQVVLAGS